MRGSFLKQSRKGDGGCILQGTGSGGGMCFVKGAIAVFMTLLFGVILSLVLVTIENVRFLTGESYARLSAKGALYAVFGEYNRELYEDYGLFGYGGYSQKNQDELSRNIERQLQTALGQQDKAASSANIDLYRIHDISCTIADIKSVADREELYRQIKLFLASETVEDVLGRLFTKDDSTNSKVGVDSLRDLFREDTTVWSKSLEQTEKYEKGEMDDPEKTSPKRKKQSDRADSQFAGENRGFDGEGGQFAEANKQSVRKTESSGNVMDGDGGMATQDHANGDPLESFCDLMRDGILQLVCDTEKLSGEDQQAKSIGQAAGLLKELLSTKESFDLQGNLTPTGQKLLLMRYAFCVFSCYTTDRNRSTRCGLEYLIEGKENEKDCMLGIVNRMLLLRTMINYAYVNTDEQLKAESLATATVIAGATGLPPVIQAINQTILLILAVEESLIDITALLCGYKVPLFKQHASFQMRYSEICMVSKSFLRKKAEIYKKGGGVITGKAMSYMQYLGMLMALTAEKSMRERAISLIETDLRERYNQTFCIDQCIDLAKVKVVYRQSLFWSMSQLGVVQEQRQLEVMYQY